MGKLYNEMEENSRKNIKKIKKNTLVSNGDYNEYS